MNCASNCNTSKVFTCAGRTSSNAYAKEDHLTIGEILNVETILEGSVRKDASNVRITVQLTNAEDGFAIWSESFTIASLRKSSRCRRRLQHRWPGRSV